MPSFGNMFASLTLESASFMSGLDAARKNLGTTQAKFDRVGKKMQSIGAAMTVGVTAPFLAIAKAGMEGAQSQRQAMAQVEAALASMGPVAGRTAEQLLKASDGLELHSLYDGDEILRKVTANLLTFGSIAGTQFDRAQQAAVNLATRMEGDLQGATLLIGKALNDPIKGMGALRKVGIQLSEQQREQVKAFVTAGNAAGAQGIILDELGRQFGGAAAAAANTDPWRQAQVAMDQAGDTIGEALLPVIPPIANAVRDAALAFGQLSPEAQRFAIYAAAGAAALGPLIGGLGTASIAIGAMLPRIMTFVGPGGLAAIGPAMAPIIVGAAAVVLAYRNWDKIGPWVEGVAERTTKAGSDIDRWFKGLNEWTAETDRRLGVPSASTFQDSIVAGARELAEEVDQAMRGIQRWADDTDAAILRFASNVGASFTRAIGSARALYDGARTWLFDKLGATLTWVTDKARAVGDAFFTLYDRVVGHSYVPDMVDEIGQHMARLDGNLVTPAIKGTDKAAAAFAALQQKVAPILDRLFPDEARLNQYQAELAALDEYAKKAGWTAEQVEEARRRLRQDARDGAPGETPVGIADVAGAPSALPDERDMDELGKVIEEMSGRGVAANDSLVESFAGMARDITGSLGSLASSIKSGDWLSALQSALDVVSQIAGAINGTGAPAQRTYSTNGMKARANGGPVMPHASYLVGERGPEILRMGGRGGQIVANDQIGGGAVVQLVVGEGQMFEPRVAGISGNVSIETVRSSTRSSFRAQRQALA